MKFRFVLSFVLLMAVSCSPLQTINFDTQLKPVIDLSNETQGMVIVNRVTNEKSKSVYVSSDFLYNGENRDGSNACVEVILKRFSDLGLFPLVPVVAEKSGAYTLMPDPLTKEEQLLLMQKGGGQLLISIEYFNAFFEKNLIENTGDGSNEAMYQAALKANFSAGIRIYKEGKVWKTYEYGEPKTIMSQATTKKEAKEKLMKKREFSEEWGRAYGNLFCDQVLPRKVNAGRLVYRGGSDAIKDGVSKLRKKKYDEARAIFEKDSANANAEVAAKALYNLAVLDEMLVSPEYGKQTLLRSMAKMKLSNSAKYLNFLNIRIQMRNE